MNAAEGNIGLGIMQKVSGLNRINIDIEMTRKFFLTPTLVLRGIVCCVALLYCSFSWQQLSAQISTKNTTYDFSPLQNKIQSCIDSGYYPGASIIIAKDNQIIYKKYFGNYTPQTVAFFASAGKCQAAAKISDFVDEGKLSLIDKVK
jgi:CubicO group peptidase (beta-lactamase class C family)